MNNNPYFNEENEEIAEVNMLPMIDIIFAILTFFIISSLYLTKIETIPVNLPEASTSSIKNQKSINVTINKDNNIYVNRISVNLPSLISTIEGMMNSNSNISIILSADKVVSYENVVRVLDKLRTIDNLKIAISTK